MSRKLIGILILFAALLLTACGNKDKYVPFTPLSKATVSPEREAALQAALNTGEKVIPTDPAPFVPEPTDEPAIVPTFDESSFFSEVDPEPTPTAKPKQEATKKPTAVPDPTKAPKPTAVKAFDPNIMMYGMDGNGLTTYTLQEGEDLICIARRFDVSLSQLVSMNGLSKPEDAGTGTVISLPDDPEPWTQMDGYGKRRLNPHPAVIVSKSGDNLFSIACTFGDVLPEDIANANKLVLGESIPAGTQISVP